MNSPWRDLAAAIMMAPPAERCELMNRALEEMKQQFLARGWGDDRDVELFIEQAKDVISQIVVLETIERNNANRLQQ